MIMGAILFGACGCCHKSLVYEQQTVCAWMPFNIGWTYGTIGGWSSTGATLGGNYLPTVTYLHRIRHWTNRVTGKTQDQNSYYDKLGNFTSDAQPENSSDDWIMYESQDTYDTPYTYAEATAAAIALLAKVDLLNPAANYTMLLPAPPSDTDPSTTMQITNGHLCYPSEFSAYSAPLAITGNYVSERPNTYDCLVIVPNIDGTTYICTKDVSGDGVPEYELTSVCGTMGQKWNGGSYGLDGRVWAAKQAFHTPFTTQSFSKYFMVFDKVNGNGDGEGNPTNFGGISGPYTLAPGEHILLPSDVDGYGTFSLSPGAPPTLPAP